MLTAFGASDLYDVPVTPRNHLIDTARIGSLLVVVIFHATLWQVQASDGQISVVPWAPGPIWWAASWVFTIIPVFFVAAGFANAVVVDKWRATGDSYGAFLTLRGSRLLGPMSLYLAVTTLVATLAAWIGYLPEASALSRQFAQLLWFAVVYLVLLGVAPLAVAAHDRFGGWVMLPLAAAVVAVDLAGLLRGNLDLQWLNLAFAWPLAHQWGIAYHRGWFRGWPAGWLVAMIAATAVGIGWLVFGVGYPPSAVAWADVLVANVLPPTSAIVLVGLAQTAALGLAQKSGLADRLGTRFAEPLRVANALALTIYLWHIPAIVLSAAVLAGLNLLLPGAGVLFLNRWLLAAVVMALVTVGVPRIAGVELRLIPSRGPGEPVPGRAEFGYWLFVAGVFAVWQSGSLVHPGAPLPTAATLLCLLGVVALRRASVSPRTSAGPQLD